MISSHSSKSSLINVSNQFESINLNSELSSKSNNPSKTETTDEDSVLDPNDYISQLHEPFEGDNPPENLDSLSFSEYPNWGVSSYNQNPTQSSYDSPSASLYSSIVNPVLVHSLSASRQFNYATSFHGNGYSSYNNLFPPHKTSSDFNDSHHETPLQFLSKKYDVLRQELQNNLRLHSKYLAKGDTQIRRIRSMILQNFDQLQEIHISFCELYEKEKTRRDDVLLNFQKWHAYREKVISKIKDIRSTRNDMGKKFFELNNQVDQVDNEIEVLEKHLSQLRRKRLVIAEELIETSSVIESRASSYTEALKTVEEQGESEINKLRKMDTAGMDLPLISAIKKIPETLYSSSIFHIAKSQSSGATSTFSDSHNNNIYEGQSDLETKSIFVSKMNDFFGSLAPKKSEATVRFGISDETSTKIDIELIAQSLNKQLEVIQDRIETHTIKSKAFKESGILWKDILEHITQLETKMVHITKNFSPESQPGQEPILIEAILATLADLKSRLDIIRSLKTFDVESALLNEMEALRKGLQLIKRSDSSSLEPNFGENVSQSSVDLLYVSQEVDTKDNEHEIVNAGNISLNNSLLNSPQSQSSFVNSSKLMPPFKKSTTASPTFAVSEPAKFISSQSFKTMKSGLFSKADSKQVKKD